ncbi:uncharacterized protein RJT21DRAFT_2752 [Scheffersomyces amazonensis]|uniref:uncharacterized protein n=1 Tax=Scheffersomyces amazonensis TaxID=1078765 RepID=UPI00315DD80A
MSDEHKSVDPLFGQYRAFPTSVGEDDTEGDSEGVSSYLRSVRRQAEEEDIVYFAHRDTDRNRDNTEIHEVIINEDNNSKNIDHIINPQWSEDLIKKFTSIKQQINLVNTSVVQNNIQPNIIPETAAECRKYMLEHDPPSIDYFYQEIDRATIFKHLIYYTKWLSKNTNEYLTKWIWISFLRIDDVLEANECSIVRDLAKKALKIISKVPQHELDANTSFTIDMILALVSQYYGQKDLLT